MGLGDLVQKAKETVSNITGSPVNDHSDTEDKLAKEGSELNNIEGEEKNIEGVMEDGVSSDNASDLASEYGELLSYIEDSEDSLERISELNMEALKNDREEIEQLIQMREHHLDIFEDISEHTPEFRKDMKALEKEIDNAVLGFQRNKGLKEDGFKQAVIQRLAESDRSVEEWHNIHGRSDWRRFLKLVDGNQYIDDNAVDNITRFRKSINSNKSDSSFNTMDLNQHVLDFFHKGENLSGKGYGEGTEVVELKFCVALFDMYAVEHVNFTIGPEPVMTVLGMNEDSLEELTDSLDNYCTSVINSLKEIYREEEEAMQEIEDYSADTVMTVADIYTAAKEVEELIEEVRHVEMEREEIVEVLHQAIDSSVLEAEKSEAETIAAKLDKLVNNTEQGLEVLSDIESEIESLEKLGNREKSYTKGLYNDMRNGYEEEVETDIRVGDFHRRSMNKLHAVREIRAFVADGKTYADNDKEDLRRYDEDIGSRCEDVLIAAKKVVELADGAGKRLDMYEAERSAFEGAKFIKRSNLGKLEQRLEQADRPSASDL